MGVKYSAEDDTPKLASTQDVSAITQLLNDALNKKRLRGDEAWGDGDFTEQEVSELLNTGDILVIQHAGDLAGCVHITKNDIDLLWPETPGNSVYIHRLATSEEYSGKGFGGKLLGACAVYAQQNGCNRLRLDCNEDNEKLCAYYKNQGFKQVSSKPKNNGKIAALFEKEI